MNIRIRSIYEHETDLGGNKWATDIETTLEGHLARVGCSDGFTEFIEKSAYDKAVDALKAANIGFMPKLAFKEDKMKYRDWLDEQMRGIQAALKELKE